MPRQTTVHLESKLPEIIERLHPAIEAVIADGAHKVVEEAQSRVPIGPPEVHLKDAIHVDRRAEGYYVIAGDDQRWYGHMVEFGTSHSAPRPFLVPALEAKSQEITNTAAAVIRGLTS
jgi:HK97 gp10 family phage protein